jgi:hypothetical protein
MAFTVIDEPSMTSATFDGWRKMLEDLEKYSNGYLALAARNSTDTADVMNTADAPSLKSVIEVNGRKYLSTIVQALSTSGNGQKYVYAAVAADGATLTFTVDGTAPVWDAIKNEWYKSGTSSRAVLKYYYSEGQYNGKVVLDGYEALARVNSRQPIPTSGGGLGISLASPNTVMENTLSAGVYRLEVAGGKGGAGAMSSDAHGGSSTLGGAGGAGTNGNILTTTLILDKTISFTAYIGGDGKDGNPADYTEHGGGGAGGASGMDSLLVFYDTSEVVKEMIAFGGSGGGGGQNSNGDGGGGGDGGSRYGVGNNGYNYNNTTLDGGNGGNCNQLTLGGPPRGSGGKGGVGGCYKNGYAGQNGEAGHGSGGDADGGNGGAKTQVDITILANRLDQYGNSNPVAYTLISCGGGGGGGTGKHVSGRAGNGATGVKTTSSGYVRIYRLW